MFQNIDIIFTVASTRVDLAGSLTAISDLLTGVQNFCTRSLKFAVKGNGQTRVTGTIVA